LVSPPTFNITRNMALRFINSTENAGTIVLTFEGSAGELAKITNEFFAARNYKLKKGTPENAVYERGNYVVRILLGAFVPYYKFNLVVAQEGSNATLGLSKAHSGFSGGVIGMAKLKKEYKRIAEGLENADSALGVYAK
jgi:hypothetical protein